MNPNYQQPPAQTAQKGQSFRIAAFILAALLLGLAIFIAGVLVISYPKAIASVPLTQIPSFNVGYFLSGIIIWLLFGIPVGIIILIMIFKYKKAQAS